MKPAIPEPLRSLVELAGAIFAGILLAYCFFFSLTEALRAITQLLQEITQ